MLKDFIVNILFFSSEEEPVRSGSLKELSPDKTAGVGTIVCRTRRRLMLRWRRREIEMVCKSSVLSSMRCFEVAKLRYLPANAFVHSS